MRIPQSGLYSDNPAYPLLTALLSYWGITTAAGAATGLTVICADLVNEPSYVGLQIKLLTGAAAGQLRNILISAAGTLTVDDAFRDNTGAAITVIAGTLFVILSQSAGGGGPVPPTGPSQGLSFMGDVTTYTNPTTFASTDLAGFGDFAFVGTYMIYVFRDAAGVAPQGEFRLVTGYAPATGTFTHAAFSAPLAVGDKVVIVHISILFPQILAFGAFTFSSTTVPADAGRLEGANYWDGCDLMPITGAAAFEPRKIMTFAAGVFYMNNPFTVAPAIGDRYIIIENSFDPVVGVDSVANIATFHVVGNKADTATPDDMSALATSSLMRDLKRVLLRLSSDAFTATIQGVARTELDTMLAQLATYIAALGAAYSATVNPGGAAKDNIEQTLEDIGDMLAGATGIVTYPAAAAPANGVSIAEVLRQIYNDVIALAGAGVLHEQADVPFNVNAALVEANIFDLSVANTRYVVRSLRLKCVDPGAETVTVRLYELVNNVQTLVDTFAITTANFATYHSLTDMFGLFQLAGDSLKVAVIATAAGPYACAGQYCMATAGV